MKKLDDLIVAVGRIEDKQDSLCSAIQSIKQVLGGSTLGDKGLVEQMTTLKVDYYQTKSDVNKLKWMAGLLGTAIAGASVYIYEKLLK